MTESLLTVAYLVAGVLFILSLGGLSAQETAKRGNMYGIVGMVIAIAATTLTPVVTGYESLSAAVIVGAAIGATVAARVVMEAMPQLVAALHSFVGAAAVLVGFAGLIEPHTTLVGAAMVVHRLEVFVGVFVGAITFTGSVVAFGKLQGGALAKIVPLFRSKPLLLPGRHVFNLTACLVSLWLTWRGIAHPETGVESLI